MTIITEFPWWIFLIVVLLAFICELTDSSLGMGYGTTLTPVLLLMGFDALQIVPAVLLSEFLTGIVSAVFHSLFKNMTLGRNKVAAGNPVINSETVITNLTTGGGQSLTTISTPKKQTLVEKVNELTLDTKVIIVLTFFGILGTLTSIIISTIFGYNTIFKFGVKVYIGIMVFAMGVLILSLRKKQMRFSFKKIICLGTIAGANKGISGGGYGPLTVSGQILSGREGKNAIASTSLSEGIICFVGALAFLITSIITSSMSGGPISFGNWELAPFLVGGAIFSAPLAALITKKVKNRWLIIIVGLVTVVLGLFSLTKTVLAFTGIW